MRRLVALGIVAALCGLVSHAGGAARPARDRLDVFAAASLADAFGELGRRLERDRPSLEVRFQFAGSQQLAVQLEHGAPADVFASADQRWMDYVAERDLIAGEARPFARNRLVVIVPRTNPARIGRLEDLARRGVKLVLAADAVPVGRYSREALARMAAMPRFGPDFARRTLANVVSEEENVKGVASKVQLGEADAGVVYRSDVTPAVARHVRVLELPGEAQIIARYPIAVLAGAKRAEDARAFVDLVLSREGQQILERHGLLPIESPSP